MLAFLAGRASARKLRLFAAAGCRRVAHRLSPQEKELLRGVEEYADGRADLEEARRRLAASVPDAEDGRWPGRWPVRRRLRQPGGGGLSAGELARVEGDADWFPEILLLPDAAWSARITARGIPRLRESEIPDEAIRLKAPKGPHGLPAWRARWDEVEEYIDAARRAERAWPAAALRDVFGNPFRPAPAVDPGVLSWHGGTVRRLAEAVYAERAFDRLPVLADALEDAGGADAELLAHYRSGGEHVRGCWAVDLILGKE
jgi:hypothetical protein